LKVDGKPYRTIWVAHDGASVAIIDQTKLPRELAVAHLATLDDAVAAIRDMQVRGAPLIGVTAAYGLALALSADSSDAMLTRATGLLEMARPTAVNLRTALDRMRAALEPVAPSRRAVTAWALAGQLADEDVAQNRLIGRHGLKILEGLCEARRDGRPIQIMTHCNAGWLATVDGGTALAPVYLAHDEGMPVHVWVSETRPRNQGAFLTAWELAKHGVAHTLIVDSAAGHLMQRGEVDVVIVGADRVTRAGDVANKIGTYLKALAAKDCGVPFYVAFPSSTIDWTIDDGREIPIEERGADEVTHIRRVRLVPENSGARNIGFDVTPARLITGLITERGICAPSRESLAKVFPDG